MTVARYSLILVLVLSSLGLSSVCLEAAGCGETAIGLGAECHGREPVIDRACCCSGEISADRSAVAKDRDGSSAKSIAPSAARQVPAGARSAPARASLGDRPPPSGPDLQSLLCVYQN